MDTSTQGRPARRVRLPRRWWTRWLLAVGVLAVVVAPAAWANHLFSDVPAASVHHGAVSSLAGAGITGGCAPGLYCPANNVRRDEMASFLHRGLGRTGASGTTADVARDEMASFLHRGLGRTGASGTTADVALTGAFQNLATDSITAGGATGGSGFVIVLAHFSVYATAGSLTDNNRIEFQIEQNGTGFLSNASWTTLYTSAVSGAPSSTVSKMWVFSQPTGTTDSYSLQARIAFGSGGPVNAFSRLIQVIYVPFGSAGTSSLGDMSSLAGGPPAVDDTP